MNKKLKNIQLNAGAIFLGENGPPLSFANDIEALQAAENGVAICDRSHWGLIQISGDDRLRYLHNQSTNEFNTAKPGQVVETVFVTSTARTIDLVTAYIDQDSVLLLVSPNRRQYLMEWMDRFIFPMDRVELKDISDDNAIFTLIGPESETLLKQLAIELQPHSSNHLVAEIEDISVKLAAGTGLAMTGYTLILPMTGASLIWSKLTDHGAIALGESLWERLRILQGRPVPEHELTEDYNPLEAGLWQSISFNKGCYIGQETITRLNTYKGVKQKLWGIKLNVPVEIGTVLTLQDEKIGILTSCTETTGGYFGLAYIRSKAGQEGLQVKIGETTAEIVKVPFLDYPE